MAYWFQGFFVATTDDATVTAVSQAARALWPEAICRRISDPFSGLGVSRTADAMAHHDASERLDAELGPWTRPFPVLTFVRIEAVCFGGECEYGGAVWRDGQLLRYEERGEPDMAPLIRLMHELGVASQNGYFEPFTRGYFAPGHAQ